MTYSLMTLMWVYIFYGAVLKRHRMTFWRRWGPLLLMTLGGPLVCLDPTRHVFADLGWWPPGPFPGATEYRPNCNSGFINCLALTGWLITFGATYLGFALIFTATMWNANIWGKLVTLKARASALMAGYRKQRDATPDV